MPIPKAARALLRLRPSALPSALRVLLGQSQPAVGALVLAYHDIRIGGSGDDYAITTAQLRRELALVQSSGHRFVTLDQLCAAMEGGGSTDGLVAVTFDDGQVGILRHAVPLLAELDVPATLYALPGLAGEDPSWTTGPRLMTESELHAVAGAGWDVGCHGWSHRSLPDVPADELPLEIEHARDRLEQVVGRPVRHFSYPFGHLNGTVRAAVVQAGYRSACTFSGGRVTTTTDAWALPRVDGARVRRRPVLAYQLVRPVTDW